MDAELMRRIEAVRMPLDLAAKDNFAGVRRIAGLGIALRAACDGLIAKEPANEALVAWRERLAGWEQLDETLQQVEVARGMRLMARYPQRQRAVVRQGPTIASLLPAVAAPMPTAATMTPASTSTRSSTAGAAKTVAAKTVAAKTVRKPKVDESIDPLAQPTHTLPGIGPAFAQRLAEKGLETVEDLLWCLPRRYDDVRDAKQLGDVAAMEEGERATFVAKVTTARMIFVRRRRWAEVRLADLELRANAVVRWFNVWAGIDKRMPPGSTVTISGVVRKREGRLEFANPDILAIDLPVDPRPEPETAPEPGPEPGPERGPGPEPGVSRAAAKPMPKLIARYPEVAGVPASKLRAACRTACARVGASADDGVPASVETAAGLPALSATLAMLHEPPDDIAPAELAALNHHTSIWQRRLVFGELFALGVAVALKRRERCADAAMPCARAASVDAVVTQALPFAPTGAQTRAIGEIADDLAKSEPMNRLLQGDVGSGKTAVAFAAAVQVARAGRQTAVMAPTEILAEQHHETWKAWAAVAGLRLALLTASTPKAVRQSLLALLGQQQIDVVIGTHALLAEAVGFGALGLVVIDEQHRFGVAQRAKLRDKGDGQGAPHLLVMTATPIPRTLALTAYGDLDVSVLDELPPGRTPVTTKLVQGKRGETAAYKLIAERVAQHERAYVVCPKVEDDNEDSDWKDATTVATELAAVLPHVRVGLVHGRLEVAARDRVMRAFKQGELDVLVATTVIEVGVDVPAATVMVIHDADRFGLAQLHQLRGRVGRGGGVAHCVLITHGGLTEEGRERLAAMVRTTDGFEIAETDLALRGPGELCGPRQAGVPRLRYGDLGEHFELLIEARCHATRVLDEDPDLVRPEHTSLRAALARRLAQSVYGAESG
ncbi:MAG: ATP-dependent DNA helicase RecG [Kofleriaceae bacterium]